MIFTVRKRSCRKVMFSQACVKNSVPGGECMCVAGGMHGREGVHGRGMCGVGGHAWQEGACVLGGGGVRGRGWEGVRGRRDGHHSGRYASYWISFL